MTRPLGGQGIALCSLWGGSATGHAMSIATLGLDP